MSDSRPALKRLADRLGVYSDYHDIGGTRRVPSDATREALCSAMGFACATEAEAEARLGELEAADRAEWLAPVHVWRDSPGAAHTVHVRGARDVEAQVEIASESGHRSRVTARVKDGELTLPFELELGAHELRVELDGRAATQLRIVVPRTAWRADESLGASRALGVWANPYTVRSRLNWGFGDLSDLARLADWLAPLGVDFVAVNPLHALQNRGDAIAPYSPVSRIFMNPLYLDVEAVPELASDPRGRAVAAQLPLERFRSARELDHAAVLAAKLSV